jgi:hypothetical protein
MTRYHDFTGLGRVLDPSHPSNRHAMIGAGLAFVAFAAISTIDDRFTVVGAVAIAVSVFLAWALGRELDPDTPRVATVAMVLAAAAVLADPPSAIITGVTLLAVRLIVGTVGAPVSVVDVAVLAGVGAIAGAEPTLWIVGLAIAIWLWSAPEVGRLRPAAMVAITVGAGVGAAYGWMRVWPDGMPLADVDATAYVLGSIAAMAMFIASRPRTVVTVTDADGTPLDIARVRLGTIAAGSFCMWAAVVGGTPGFWAMGPVFAALLTTAIFRFFVHPA